MEVLHPLKTLLQFQLATDASSVLHLPYVLSSLTQDSLSSSSHLTKWTNRINSLLHSKDAGARWAGLCIAHKTSILSRSTMIECAQSWLVIALPLLSKNEPPPTIKASIRLLRIIFSAGVGTPEYQRQVATPNISKFTAAIIAIAEKNRDKELRALILTTLARLVPLYPTLYRPSYTALSTLVLRFLNGSAPNPTSDSLLRSASRLYTVLHFTGGKIGAANLWRKSLDETLVFGWNAFLALRTTFPSDAVNVPISPSIDEALIGVPLHLDRLRCCTVILCDLLSTTTHRPVQLSLGPLMKFISALLSCTKDDKGREHLDPSVHTMELSLVPEFWKFGCDLTSYLARCAGHHLTPHLTRLISNLTYHMEQKPTSSQRLFILTAIQTLLTHCHLLDSPLVPNRLAKAVLPSLSVVLVTPTESQASDDTSASQRSRKGKKRARGYEGDEVFKLSKEVICPGHTDGRVLFIALEVMRLILRNPNLSSAMQSISARVLLSMLLALPQISPTSLSAEPKLHMDLLQLVQSINTELGSGTSSVLSKSLGLVVRATMVEDNEDTLRDLEILLHPRVPPLVRSLPHVESLSLYRAEESQEEADVREELGLHGAFPHQSKPVEEDIIMGDSVSPETQPVNNIQPVRIAELSPPKPVSSTVANTSSEPQPASLIVPVSVAIECPRLKPLEPKSLPQTVIPQPAVAPAQDERDDEEMPAINMDSDSDEE
ncbi:hypothetical protein J132_06140 [Termitomyces sp. J132]|nr:hypothetical protein H2248_006554 [Termitomyces sp. 'cryptogamus']KNZ77145.1 hypothetical protein J132_06140 [Termitomyces sp. J132]